MSVKTGVDLVTRVIDESAQGAAQVEDSISRMGQRIERQADGIGERFAGNFVGKLVGGLALAKFGEAVVAGMEAHRAGESAAIAFGESFANTLKGVPVLGGIGKLLAEDVTGEFDRFLPLGLKGIAPIRDFLREWIDPGGALSLELDQGGLAEQQRRTQEQQIRDIRRRNAEERDAERRRLIDEQEQERERLRREHEQQRREHEEQRQQERLQRERERMEERRQREEERQQAEALRLAEARSRSIGEVEGRLAGVTDSRGLTGRAAAFLQERSPVNAMVDRQDVTNRILRDIAERQRQIAEQWTQLEVVG